MGESAKERKLLGVERSSPIANSPRKRTKKLSFIHQPPYGMFKSVETVTPKRIVARSS
jgi:hypothetical protein